MASPLEEKGDQYSHFHFVLRIFISWNSVGNSNSTCSSQEQPPAHREMPQIPFLTNYFPTEQEIKFMEHSSFLSIDYQTPVLFSRGLVHRVNGLQGILKETNTENLLTSHSEGEFCTRDTLRALMFEISCHNSL